MEGILRWLQSLARTAGSSDETETEQDLFFDTRTTRKQLAWLARIRAVAGAGNVGSFRFFGRKTTRKANLVFRVCGLW